MKPIEFPEQNCVYAKNQPEYLPLAVHKTEEGEVISCWKLTWKERIKVLIGGKVWIHLHTFNKPLQPQFAQIDYPFIKKGKKNK